MPTYKAPVGDTLFLLNDVLHIDRYGNLPGFADASPDLIEAVLSELAALHALAEAGTISHDVVGAAITQFALKTDLTPPWVR